MKPNFSKTEIFLNNFYCTERLSLDDQLAALFAANTNSEDVTVALVNMIREINANVK
jgi:hypothetical protein